MRSILKSHKRTDSSVSDPPNSPLETPQMKTPILKSNDSPRMAQSVKKISPMNGSALNQPPKSSPKKLLSPIKKMFGHHSRTTAPPTTEALQSMVNGDIEPQRGNNSFLKTENSTHGLSESHSSDNSPSQGLALLADSSSLLFEGPHKLKEACQTSNLKPDSNNDHISHHNSSVSLDSRPDAQIPSEMPIIPPHVSDLSISTSRSSLHLSSNKSEAGTSRKIDTEASYEADEDSKDSDTSSQFSFVKDIRGGRNTSVKYYKTKTTNTTDEVEISKNYFNVEDLGFEEDDLSDYDFENNGISEDGDLDDGFAQSTNRYEDLLSDKDSVPKVGASGEVKQFPGNYKSQSLSSAGSSDERNVLDALDFHDENLQLSALKSPEYADDFLDTYLEARSPMDSSESINAEDSKSGDPHDDFHPTDLTHRTDMGLGIEFQGDDSHNSKCRKSVSNMMDILKNLECDARHHATKTQDLSERGGNLPYLEFSKNQSNNLQTENHIGSTQNNASGVNRQSVADMLATLSILGNSTDNLPYEAQAQEVPNSLMENVPRQEKKRYSWFSNEDSFGKSETAQYPGSEDGPSYSLEEDLLDEINLLPENFDFNDEETTQKEEERKEISGFLRTNSYNKKPKKIVQDRTFQEKKIQLPNKTVTFYRSKSLEREEPSKTRNPIRVASLRSVLPFNEENISEGEEDAFEGEEKSSNQRLSAPVFSSKNLIQHKSANLEPITENEASKSA
ncbi:hypothetical protein JCM33374_g795 [Metschnikowia sp. JCM 33374]|nr:hypothetical protein JCM33374_g795 [Metschnikowia sp. JCM 33374]